MFLVYMVLSLLSIVSMQNYFLLVSIYFGWVSLCLMNKGSQSLEISKTSNLSFYFSKHLIENRSHLFIIIIIFINNFFYVG